MVLLSQPGHADLAAAREAVDQCPSGAQAAPSLLSEQIALFTAIEDDLADAIAERLPDGDPRRPRLIAAAYLTALRIASHLWQDDPDAAPLIDQVVDALAGMAGEFE